MTTVTVLSGGVGAARLLRGMLDVVDPGDITAVVNTGDDTVLHGLSISPDLDTITYTLADAIDPERGWGLAGETWQAMAALERYAGVRPDGSSAAPTWFNLGDTDLATHFYRTARLREGARLTEVTAEIASAWGLGLHLRPMTDHRFRTMVALADGTEVSFQDYFVRLRHDVSISAIRFDHDGATPTAEARAAIVDADVVVVAPSNPIVSIGPLRELPEVDQLLAARRSSVVAVSPIIGGAALKGPADRMLTDLGIGSSVVGVAEVYRDIAGTLVIDEVDRDLVGAVNDVGMRCFVAPTIMRDRSVAADLSRRCLDAAGD